MRDRPIRHRSYRRPIQAVLATAITWIGVQAPLSAQTYLFEGSEQTSIRTLQRTLQAASPAASPAMAPRRPNRGPYYPATLDAALPFPTPVLPDVTLPLHLVIRLGERRVYVYRGDTVDRSYPIAVGRAGWETPTGEYEVLSMIEHPEWRNPFTGDVTPAGASNPLGERWIGFWTDGQNYIGFHGTPNEGSVGRAASHGCVRMYNRDVRELFEIVALGTPVIVEP